MELPLGGHHVVLVPAEPARVPDQQDAELARGGVAEHPGEVIAPVGRRAGHEVGVGLDDGQAVALGERLRVGQPPTPAEPLSPFRTAPDRKVVSCAYLGAMAPCGRLDDIRLSVALRRTNPIPAVATSLTRLRARASGTTSRSKPPDELARACEGGPRPCRGPAAMLRRRDQTGTLACTAAMGRAATSSKTISHPMRRP